MASIVVTGDTSGAITIAAPAVAGTNTLTLPASTGTLVVTGGAQTIEFADGSAAAPSITNSGDTNTGMFFPAADTIAFTEGGVESMRINSSGEVSIGGQLTGSLFHVNGSSGATIISVGDSAQTEPLLFMYSDATNNTSEVRTRNNFPLVFGTNNTERMRITSGGELCVGTTSAIASGRYSCSFNGQTANGIVLQTTFASTGTDFIRFLNSAGNTCGEIEQNGTTTVQYLTSSDYRLKENVVPMTGALAKVSALKPVTYKWKSDGSDGQGFIAHELQEVVPDCVSGEKDAVDAEGNPKYQGIDTSFLVATLTAAIQEQQQIINDLKARIETLENA